MRAERLAAVALALAAHLLAGAPAAAPVTRPVTTRPASGPAVPRYNLRQLVSMARSTYPGVEAARRAVAAMEHEVFRGRWAWLPAGNVRGLLAPAPYLKCYRTDANGNEVPDSKDCTHTNTLTVNSFNIGGVLGRIDVEVGVPLYTFGKLSSAKRAARAGLEVREAQLRSTEDKLEVDVTKAYWGLKLAREILFTLREGRGYIIDAEKNIEEDLEEDKGEYTLTDLLRIQTARAEIDVRQPEVEKLERIALATLRTLTGQRDRPFDVDTELLEVLGGEPLPVQSYLKLALARRPELRLLESALRARHAAVDLERARFFPDFLFVAMIGYGRTTSVDWPQNAFYNNPFNYFGAGFGLALSWRLEPALQLGSFRKAKQEVEEARARQDEASLGVQLEIRKAHADLVEARERLEAARKGEKAARSWLVATSQNLAAGLSETRDLTDALLGFFQLRLRYLQAIYDVNVGWSELGRAIGARPQRQGAR